MGLTYAQGLVLLLSASMWAIGIANPGWQYGFNYTRWAPKRWPHRPNNTYTPRKINVGGSNNWQFGFNYIDWAYRNGPFYVNDTLVFKYNPPSQSSPRPHNVYLLPDQWSFLKCNMSGATMVADTTQGGGDGFEFVLTRPFQPYYFACGIGDGFHCNNGTMKFFVMPWLRRWQY